MVIYVVIWDETVEELENNSHGTVVILVIQLPI